MPEVKLYNILQHYTKDEEPFVRMVFNSMEDIVFNYGIKEMGFCNPNEIEIIKELAKLFSVNISLNGGYKEAELVNVIIYSEYEIENKVCIYELIYNTKFNELEHKHIMGTLYNAGISERLIGDIIVSEDRRCQIILSDTLKDNVELFVPKYKNIPVRYQLINEISIVNKKMSYDIRAARSLRIDSICKAITRISRTKMAIEIQKGNVSVNHKIITNTKHIIEQEDLVSIKGYGRAKITDIIPVNGKYNIKFLTTNKK